MSGLSYDQLIENLPEFAEYKLTDTKRTAFKKWISIISKNFDPSLAGDDTETRVYAHSLYVAHLARLNWLPNNGLVPAIVLGDNTSQNASEGSVSVSYSRISYSEFLTDPYLSLTSYGSQLAYILRANAGVSITVI